LLQLFGRETDETFISHTNIRDFFLRQLRNLSTTYEPVARPDRRNDNISVGEVERIGI
jgi:hypothetical protein